MPRVARRRDPERTHHIICRSISEISLFRSETDKIKYLNLMGLYCKKLQCSIISYCLMDTHVHIQFDPQGCDISKFMHGLNLCYAMYYNKKYQRHGPVFQGRFKNMVIEDDVY
ncbi:MAG: transposase, partial [Eubacteriaceae bacterium]